MSQSAATLERPTAPQDISKTIAIPSCPKVLIDLRDHIARDDANGAVISRMVSSDAALSIAVLRTINSPSYGLRRQIDSIPQAVSMMGMQRLAVLIEQVLIRQALAFPFVNLTRFWDTADKRSLGMLRLARELKAVDPELARSFGLFCDIGIPLLMQRFPSYTETLKLANDTKEHSFTEIEFQRHGMDHAQMGSMMAKIWQLNPYLINAIKRHHDYRLFRDPNEQGPVAKLVAMMLLTDLAIQRHSRLNAGNEWLKGGDSAAGALLLSDQDVDDCVDILIEEFCLVY